MTRISERWVAVLMATALAAPAAAQEADYVSIAGIRSGTVAPGGTGFVGLSWSSKRDTGGGTFNGTGGFWDRTDGSIALGFGLGDAETGIGVQVTANITSLSDDFGDAGYFTLKAATRLNRGGAVPLYVALTADHLAGWGEAKAPDESIDLVLTALPVAHLGGKDRRMMLTLGAGSNVRDNGDAGLYLGAGMALTDNLSVSAAWSGEEVTLGTGFRLDALPNTHFTAAVDDVFDNRDGRRVSLQVVWAVDDLFGGGF
jgi:hypothetical protein